jgi:DtxR family transcriptional regulator, Mn-dependent transcriptional regulator
MTRLSVLPAGATARVVVVATDLRDRAERLASLGISPGSEIELLQRKPAFVLRAGETQVAIDQEIARRIFVQRVA